MSNKKNDNILGVATVSDESLMGFPIGHVAQSIRKIISPTLSNHDVECITVILVSHLMIEEKLNSLIIKWLGNNLPEMSTKNKKGLSVNAFARNELETYVNKMDFVKKLYLIKPLGTILWGDESEDIFKDFHKINQARVDIAHRLDIKSTKIDNKSLATEAGIERFLGLAQQRLLDVGDLIELIDG